MTIESLMLDSITDVADQHRETVVLSGSHGGHYPAALASQAGVRAVIFNDAGIGMEDAGIAGVMALAEVGMAAAAVDAMSARIGDTADMLANGIISRANDVARELGVVQGQSVEDALRCLVKAPLPRSTLPKVAEARTARQLAGRNIHLLDSASLVRPEDAGEIVVTGSHGGLIGGDPARAIKAPVRLAVYNDAGGGRDGAGLTRLPALDQRGIAGATVDCRTARIGDAVSAFETGVISHANAGAVTMGAAPGMPLRDWLSDLP
jgi:uncharacterized protein YunC (DUF1805 family)